MSTHDKVNPPTRPNKPHRAPYDDEDDIDYRYATDPEFAAAVDLIEACSDFLRGDEPTSRPVNRLTTFVQPRRRIGAITPLICRRPAVAAGSNKS